MTRAFIDTSVFFSACYSDQGASFEIFRLSLQGHIHVVNPSKGEVLEAARYTVLKDAPIVAAAKKAHVDYLVSLDRKHLVNDPEVSKQSGLRIVLPEDFLRHR